MSDLKLSNEAIVLACGALTFLLRFLPIWLAARRDRHAQAPRPWLVRLSQAAGPAAIAAMLVVSSGSFVAASVSPMRLAAIAVSLCAVWLAHRRGAGIGSCTFAGALAYGFWRFAEMHFAG